ncbi:alpha/beta hydrolase [Fructobacillus sp. M2-14]|uniref:Alpha/beta hydrolase n=1 Tax=Fructobacillus broussonetiae TaxID=2713173 RepID=A0ABS5R1C1_9LACO|nr:alpha/beta hydrolase [Fructobacillus broussonetiae]MBS9339238.1 alpha/beta hydrolase [Fructobacillus broussonetiae]
MYTIYTKNEQFNFQINRFMEPYKNNQAIQTKIIESVKPIQDLESWYKVWNGLAIHELNNKNYGLASAYYQLADFYLLESDSRKKNTYNNFKNSFYQSIDTKNINFDHIPYKQGYLPVAFFKNENATKTLIIHGGFDSYLEELIRLVISYNFLTELQNYQIILFEGPGQGEALRSGLSLELEWEEPVSAILEYFQINEADLMGMSLGGFLAARASAFQKKIKRVVLFDIMYDMSRSLTMKLPKMSQFLKENLSPEESSKLNVIVSQLQKSDSSINFMVHKAKDIFQVDNNNELFTRLSKFNMNNDWDKISQDVLLLVGTKDMYVPYTDLYKEMSSMNNARSLTAKLFTEKSGGERHCQVGNKELAMSKIIEYLRE